MDPDVLESASRSPKDERWQEALDRVKRIEEHDPHGLKMDEGVKKAVMGLDVLGFTTTASCEGHVDRGNGFPYIRITNMEAMQLQRNASDAYVLQRHTDYERYRDKADELNETLLARLAGYLNEFYASREVDEDTKLLAEIDASRLLLRNAGSEKQKTAPLESRSTNLANFQQEITMFANFLEKKFFEA